MWVIDIVERIVSAVDTQFKFGDGVAIAWYTEYPLGFRTAESEHAIREKGQNDRYFLLRVVALL
jgi:hypothetical protein